MSFRSRAFCFTINNDTEKDLDLLLNATFVYLCFGFEVAPKTKTPHIQGYIYFAEAKTISSVKKNVLPRAHIEVSKGTTKQNQVYTSKLGTDNWYEFGEPPAQGKAKWNDIVNAMSDPTNNPILANQYGKFHRQMTYCKKKNHDRSLQIINDEDRYKIAKTFKSDEITFCFDEETYNDERIMFIPCYSDSWIMDWINGFPIKIKRGFEILYVDPEIVFIMYRNVQELNYINKKYSDYIEYHGEKSSIS